MTQLNKELRRLNTFCPLSFRDINVNYKMNLEEVHSDRKEAVFRKLDSDTGETKTVKVSALCV